MKKELVASNNLIKDRIYMVSQSAIPSEKYLDGVLPHIFIGPSFMFQLTVPEYDPLRSQNVTVSSEKNTKFQNNNLLEDSLRFQNGTSKYLQGGKRYLFYVFIEQCLVRKGL